jgi:hypothetical protein
MSLMLPEGFEFSQGSLQDYVDCKRRFQLKVLEGQPWPAVEVEPALEHEAYSVYGQQFHRLLERYYSGIPEEVLTASLQDEPLQGWWQAFKQDPPLNLPQTVLLSEVRLSVSIAGQRLVAVFDLLAIDPGQRLVIVDWKTGRYRPDREVMAQRLQTLVYPFVAAEAAAYLFGEAVDPARVSMVYWFANYADQPHVFFHDGIKHEEIRVCLAGLIEEIVSADGAGVWDLVQSDERCKYCEYRSLCNRGVKAVLQDELFTVDAGDVDDFLFDLDDANELVY